MAPASERSSDLCSIRSSSGFGIRSGERRTADGMPHSSMARFPYARPLSPRSAPLPAGLMGGRILKAGQMRTIDLAQLTLKLRARGSHLTPGAVAAHALGWRLAARAADIAQRRQREERLLIAFLNLAKTARLE